MHRGLRRPVPNRLAAAVLLGAAAALAAGAAAAGVAPPFTGHYAGAQVGFGALETDLDGPRAGTTAADDTSANGFVGGLFVGYGRGFGSLYLGGELEAAAADIESAQRLAGGGRLQDLRKGPEAAATLRAGYLVDGRTLLFGRAGLAWGRFAADIRPADGSIHRTEQDLWGLRFGLGGEFAASPHLALRLEYVHTLWDAFGQPWSETGVAGVDTYDTGEGTVRVGLAWHFTPLYDGAADDEPGYVQARRGAAGAYVGLQTGYQILSVRQKGPRGAADLSKSDDLGRGGFQGGLFGGFGTFFDRLYVGADFEGSGSDTELESSRLPGSRVTRVTKRYDVAAAARLGYLLTPGTLIYGRLGVAAARFNTDVILADGRAYDQDDTQIGIRAGAGAEVALGDPWFLRLDYAYTRYNGYEVDRTSAGQLAVGDVHLENFENEESAFRVGLGYRFGQPQPRGRTTAAATGLALGSFTVHPTLTLSETYDDNIFSTRAMTVDDFVTVITPALAVESQWDRHLLKVNADAGVVRYADNGAEDHENYSAAVDGRYDLTDNANLFAGAAYALEHEGRESADDVSGSEPTRFDRVNAYAGAFARRGNASVRAGGTFRRLDFDDVPATGGMINNDDRDRRVYTGGVWAGYVVMPRVELYGQAAVDVRRYDSAVDDAGFDRDSDGQRYLGGVKVELRRGVKADLYAGYLTQDYDDPRLADVTAPLIGAKVEIPATAATTITGYLDRTLSETTLAGASGSVYTSVGLKVGHDLTPDLRLNLDASYGNDDYRGIKRSDDILQLGLGLKYGVTPNLSLGASYGYRNRDSDVLGQNYSGQQVSLFVEGAF
ncbi:MAG: outer membrane beta-barrel protein [Hyphomicrobiales bacterium]|nr:outer membrane beta-barrel protein [Hyphomicrobiales bacterium]